MSRELAEKAWNKVKAKDDPEFAASQRDHQLNLEAAAADVVRTGVTINEFERAVLEESRKAKKNEPKTALGTSAPTALGTTNEIGEPPPKAEAKSAKAEEPAKADDKAAKPADKK